MHFVTTFKEFHQPSPRTTARHYALSALSLLKANEEQLKQNRVVFTCFHSFFKDNEANLRKQLELLAKHFTFISYSEGVQRVATGNIDANYICFSSDDGYKSFYDACKIFDEFGAKALVFANPESLNETNYDTLKQFNHERLMHGPMEFLNWNEIDDLLARGHEVGNHTFGHINLSYCSSEDLEKQIVESYDVLKKHIGPDLHFAWPYGSNNDITQEALDLIYDTGHISASAVDRYSHTEKLDVKKERSYIIREQIEPFYPIDHVKYFLSRHHDKDHPFRQNPTKS